MSVTPPSEHSGGPRRSFRTLFGAFKASTGQRTSRSARRRLRAMVAGSFVAATALLTCTVTPAQAADIPEGGLAKAAWNYTWAPNSVAGANDWSCKPSAAHPNPVILLPGTFANIGANFVKAGPRLKNEGYCVYAMNYGMNSWSFNRVGGLDHVKDSAAEFNSFVSRVQQSTGAKKIDIVGHSQGGSVPMWWMKKMGGAAKVDHYVGWAPSSHGTDLSGIVNLIDAFQAMGFVMGFADWAGFPGPTDQARGSAYTKELWADGNTVPTGPKYTVIMSNQDKVVTPYNTQALSGADVNNVLLQERCPGDKAGHVGLFNDGPTLQLTLNALADGPKSFRPTCTDFGVQYL